MTQKKTKPIFVKRIVTDGHYSYTKHSMSSEDWDKAFEMLKTMLVDK